MMFNPTDVRAAFQSAFTMDLHQPAAIQTHVTEFLAAVEMIGGDKTRLTAAKEEGIWKIAHEVADEVVRANAMFDPLNSPHEALGVIEEEWEEYKAEVWKYNPRKNRDTRPRQREELIQLAAMAVRAVLDTIDFGKHYEAQPCNPVNS
jgi:hypothetical protein